MFNNFNLLPKSIAAIWGLVNFSGGRNKGKSSGQQGFFSCGEMVTAEVDHIFFPICWPWLFLPSAQFSLNGQAKVSKGHCLYPGSSDSCLSVCGSFYHLVLMRKCCLEW